MLKKKGRNKNQAAAVQHWRRGRSIPTVQQNNNATHLSSLKSTKDCSLTRLTASQETTVSPASSDSCPWLSSSADQRMSFPCICHRNYKADSNSWNCIQKKTVRKWYPFGKERKLWLFFFCVISLSQNKLADHQTIRTKINKYRANGGRQNITISPATQVHCLLWWMLPEPTWVIALPDIWHQPNKGNDGSSRMR